MRTKPIRLYTWRVLVLEADHERTMRFRVIARSEEEAESIGADLARLGGYTGEVLATAMRCDIAVPADAQELADDLAGEARLRRQAAAAAAQGYTGCLDTSVN